MDCPDSDVGEVEGALEGMLQETGTADYERSCCMSSVFGGPIVSGSVDVVLLLHQVAANKERG